MPRKGLRSAGGRGEFSRYSDRLEASRSSTLAPTTPRAVDFRPLRVIDRTNDLHESVLIATYTYSHPGLAWLLLSGKLEHGNRTAEPCMCRKCPIDITTGASAHRVTENFLAHERSDIKKHKGAVA